jgi:hypothetical protein
MTPITAPSLTTAVPDAIVASPGQAPVQRRDGPLRNDNPRGNPNLAPRCGAKARTTGCACQAPAMANGRCRSHGGKSTGPRTPEGRASVARAHTAHGQYAQAGFGAELRVATRQARVLMRRIRVTQAAYRHLRWLPRALAARLQADAAPELRAPVHYLWLLDKPVAETPGSSARGHAAGPTAAGRAPGKPRRDARGRFAAPPPPVLRGRKAELARAHAEAAALAPWKAALARARMIKRLMKSQDQAARRAELGRDAVQRPLPGSCPGGGAGAFSAALAPEGGAAGEDSDTNSMNRGAGGGTAAARADAPATALAPKGGAASEGSDTNSMMSLPPGTCPGGGAGGGTAATRAEAPAAALAPKDAAAGEDSDMNSMNRGAGGGTAAARADAPAAALAPKGGAASEGSDTNSMNRGAGGGTAGARAEAPAAALAPRDAAACEGSDTNSMNSGAGGGTAGARADAPAAAVAPRDAAACEGSDTNSMNRGAGGGTAAARADAPAAAVAPKGGAAGEGSDTNSMNRGAGGGTAAARAEAPAAALAPKGGAASEGSDTNSMNRGAGGGTAAVRAEAPATALAPKDGAAGEDSDTNSMMSLPPGTCPGGGAGGGTAASDAILAALPNRAARRRWKSLQRRAHPAPRAIG